MSFSRDVALLNCRNNHIFRPIWTCIVPGVGPMTVAMLLYNTVDSCKRSNATSRILKVSWIEMKPQFAYDSLRHFVRFYAP